MSLLDDLQRRWRAAWLEASTPPVPGASRLARWRLSPAASRIGAAALLVFLIYYGLLGWAAHDINTDLGLRPDAASLPPSGSATVGLAARLLDRVVEEQGWTPNDPFFLPTAFLDNMPAFQRGMRDGVAAFAADLRDQLAAAGDPGASDLRVASEGLAVPAERWWLHASWPFVGGSAEAGLRDAVAALRRYNGEVAAGRAGFARDDKALADHVGELADSLAASGGAIERRLTGRSDEGMDEVYYTARGRAYAAALLMRGLRSDFGALLRARQLGTAWGEAEDAVDEVATHSVWHVGDGDLSRQGYRLLLARDKLRALAAMLRRG